MNVEPIANAMSLAHRLHHLRDERDALNTAINHLCKTPAEDELALLRLKKRKHILGDRIALIERLLDGDAPA